MIKHTKKGGFTLLEMIVSVGLFTIILFFATSAFLTVVSTNRKMYAVRIATDNLNLALEDMSRRIKTGSTFYCGAVDTGGEADCSSGGNTLYFTDQNGFRTKYTSTGGAIWRTITGLSSEARITSPEIVIEDPFSGPGLKFFVNGSLPFGTAAGLDKVQPVVTVVVDGKIVSGGLSGDTRFRIQTTLTQRLYDH